MRHQRIVLKKGCRYRYLFDKKRFKMNGIRIKTKPEWPEERNGSGNNFQAQKGLAPKEDCQDLQGEHEKQVAQLRDRSLSKTKSKN